MQRAWGWAWGWLRRRDWPLVIIVAAFILLVPLFAVWVPPLSRLAKWLDASTISIYERAIMKAAVKTTAYEKAESLETIDPSAAEIQVVTVKATLPTNPLADDAWVSLPAELRSKCAGKPDPAQALREILGLPPGSGSQSVYRMTVMRDDK